jgi:short-subunit dehydrogenase
MENSRLFRGAQVMTASDVAEAGYAAMCAGKPLVITGAVNRMMAFGTRVIPRRLAARVAKLAQQDA